MDFTLNSIFLRLGIVKQLSNRRLNGQCNWFLKCQSLINRANLCILSLWIWGYRWSFLGIFMVFKCMSLRLTSCKIILQVVAENIIIVVFGSCPLTNKAWLDHNSFEPNLGPPTHWCQTDSVLVWSFLSFYQNVVLNFKTDILKMQIGETDKPIKLLAVQILLDNAYPQRLRLDYFWEVSNL